MATTHPNRQSSGQLRRSIGLQASRLSRILPAARAALPPLDNPTEDDEIKELFAELSSLHRSVAEPFTKLQQLHQQWLTTMGTDEKEKAVYNDFVSRKGDYTRYLADAISLMEDLDARLHGLESLAEELNVTIPRSPQDSVIGESPPPKDIGDDPTSVFIRTPKALVTHNHQDLQRTQVTQDETVAPGVLPGPPLPTSQPQPMLTSQPQPMPTSLPFVPTSQPQPMLTSPPQLLPTPLPMTMPPSMPQHPMQSFTVHHPLMPPQYSLATLPGPQVPLEAGFLEAALLQRLDVPTFSGKIEDFPEFWTRFSSLVHSKSGIDPGSKFSLLKSCLRGPPLDSMAGIPVTSTNYELAISLLHATYNDPTTIRHLLYSRLMSLPRCDEKTLSQRFAQMNALVRQFVCLDPTGSQEFGLAACLFEKLPRSIRARILDKTPHGSNLTPTSLMDLLGEIVRREFIIDRMSPKELPAHDVYYNSGKPGHKQKHSHFEKPEKHSSFGDHRRPARCCSFCEGTHGPFSCSLTLEDRLQAVKEKHLCFNCLSPDHGSRSCPSGLNCKGCNRRHHTTICKSSSSLPPESARGSKTPSRPLPGQTRLHASSHKESPPKPRRTEQSTYVATEKKPSSVTTIAETTCSATMPENSEDPVPHNASVALMCLPVTLCNPDKPEIKVETIAFFDSGSTRSYISREVAKSLNLQILMDEDIVINVFGEQKTTLDSQLHHLQLYLPDGGDYPMEVRSLPALAHDVPCAVLPADFSTNNPTSTLERKTPGLLVGSDHFWQLILWDGFSAKPLDDGLRLLHTRLGPVLAGPTLTMESVYYAANEDHSNPLNKDRLDQLVERFWEFETVGLTEPSQADADTQCLDLFQKTIRFDAFEKRFYCKWPFRMPTEELPSNMKLAYSRLWNTWKVLSKSPENMRKYLEIIADQLNRNIIEIVPSTPADLGRIHYLAHHAVVTENKKTTKVRMVFDASAKEKGKLSLNDTLFRGPVLLPDICGILLRARLSKILISADIEKAFLMVGLEEPDRDFTRFLWLKDPNKQPWENNLITLRFRRVPFGIVSSPFMLAGTIHHLLTNCEDQNLSSKILRNLYVDNIFVTTKSVEEGQQIYTSSKELFNSAGMNLREWASNDSKLNHFLGEREGAATDTDVKLLGLHWNTHSDTLKIHLQQPPEDKSWTKRRILQFTAATFDPLGLLSPIILRYKLFIQRLWKEDLHWDEALSPAQLADWTSLLQEDHHSSPFVEHPRLLSSIPQGADVTLHVFSDACKDGMGACAYLRVQDADVVTVSLLMAKTRICPTKREITIPRLELSALATASSLANYLRKELKMDLDGIYLWTDSTAALGWCNSSKDHLPIFVSNRVALIRSNVPEAVIQHVSGLDNPADLASRGVDFSSLLESSLWWNGPQFLKDSKDNWNPLLVPAMPSLENEEPCSSHVLPDTTFLAVHAPQRTLLDPTRFSSWTKMLNTIMLVLLFIKLKTGARFSKMLLGPWFGPTEGILRLFRMAQQERPPTDHAIKQLNLYLDKKSNLWKMTTRVDQLETLFYLPPDSRITELYILHVHSELLHGGVSTTLNQLRRKVWIPKGRSTVKKVIRAHCFECRRQMAKPFALPPFPALPDSRTKRPPYPFFNSGMDYLGPFTTSENKKVHICLFTCLSTRLIHAEVAVDLRATTFTNILRLFIATHGSPRNLISDNALHFTTSASVYLQLLLKDSSTFPEFDALCSHHRIHFKFIPAFAPWAGGTYERMVGLLKSALGHCLTRTPPCLDNLRTFLAEAVAVVNSRPLTYVCSDPHEKGITSIRPIDFIRPSANICAPSFDIEEDSEWTLKESTRKELLEIWHNTTSRLDRFWDRWTSEYLQELKERYQRKHEQGHHLSRRLPIQGEVVLIHQEHISRGLWKLGKIVHLNSDVVRSADVRLASGKVITRPISLLYPLEILPSPSSAEPIEDQEKAKKNDKPRLEGFAGPKNTHRMVTRSKARLHLLFATVLLCLFAPVASTARCTKNAANLQIIFAENCRNTSIALASFGTSEKVLCWTTVTCPLGHIRFQPSAKRPPNTKMCGDQCPCPTTVTCTHYSGPRVNESQARLLPDSFSTYTPPYVCSFTPSSLCSNVTEMTTVPFITLHDGTTYIVEALNIHQPEYDAKDSPVCFQPNGSPAPFSAELRKDGTPGFCSAFDCVKDFQIFCALRTPTAIYSTENFTIPVSNWGHSLKSYHPFPAVSKKTAERVAPVILCAKGGVRLFNTDHHFVEVCINPSCIRHSDYEDGTPLLFPTSQVIFDYNAEIKMWKEGSLTFSSSKKCPGHPICETISCTFCYEHLWNYSCWTLRDALLMVFSWIVLSFISLVLSPIRLILQMLRLLLRPLRWIWNRLCCCCSRRSAVPGNITIPTFSYTRKRRRHQLLNAITTVMLALQVLQQPIPSSACADTITVSGTSTNCITNGDQETCHLEFSTTVTLQPLSQEMCFVLRDQDNHPAAVLTISLSSVQHRCNKRILFYTRDHKFYSESSHRCYKAGSCQSERCENTKTKDRLEEFTNSANDSPGFTFCTSSCGCVTCNGCFLCSPSCLFYRYYASPTSSTVYNIFDCPTWTTTVIGTATLEKEGAPLLKTAFNLDPARPFRWNSFTLTLASHSNPPLPVLGKTFIDNGQKTALLPESISNFGLNSPGQLKCLSFEEAKTFSCTFSAEVCNCVPASYSVKCQCTDGDIAKYLAKTPLPIYTQQVMISHSQGTISASTAQGTAVQLILSTKDLKWTTRITKNSCSLKIHHQLHGCYSCLSGGRMTVSCHSSPGDEIADIECGPHRTVIRCTPEGQQQELIFNLNEAEVKIECKLKCRFEEPQTFQMEGTLSYVSDVIPLKDNSAPSHTRIHAYDPLELLSSALDWISSLFSNLLVRIAIVSLILGAVLLLLWCYRTTNKEKKIYKKKKNNHGKNPQKTL